MVALGIVLACLILSHFLVFAPLASKWTQATSELRQNTQKVEDMLGREVPLSNPVLIINETKKVLAQQYHSLQNLTQEFSFQDLSSSEATGDIKRVIISKLHEIEELQKSQEGTGTTELRLLQSWGINDRMAPGKFGQGLLADKDNPFAFPIRETLVDEGSIEFFFKPQWVAASDREARVLATLIGYQPIAPGSNPDIEPPTCSISIVKTSNADLSIQLAGYSGNPLSFGESIVGWEPDTWRHIAASWSKEKDEANLYVDGQLHASSRFAGRTSGGRSMGEFDFGGGFDRYERGGARRPRSTTGSRSGVATVLESMSRLQALYMGRSLEGGAYADGVIDDLRVSTTALNAFQIDKTLKEDESTILLRHFESELPPGDEEVLARDLTEMENNLVYSANLAIREPVRKGYEREYDVIRRSFGIDVEKIETENPENAVMEELYLADYLSGKVKSRSLEQVIALFGFSIPDIDSLRAVASFVDIAKEIATIAIDERVPSVKQVSFAGESLVQNEEDVWVAFEQKYKEMDEKFSSSSAGGAGALGMPGMTGTKMAEEMLRIRPYPTFEISRLMIRIILKMDDVRALSQQLSVKR